MRGWTADAVMRATASSSKWISSCKPYRPATRCHQHHAHALPSSPNLMHPPPHPIDLLARLQALEALECVSQCVQAGQVRGSHGRALRGAVGELGVAQLEVRRVHALDEGDRADEIGEVVASLARLEPRWVAHACDVLEVGVKEGWVGSQRHIDEQRQEIVRAGHLPDETEGCMTTQWSIKNCISNEEHRTESHTHHAGPARSLQGAKDGLGARNDALQLLLWRALNIHHDELVLCCFKMLLCLLHAQHGKREWQCLAAGVWISQHHTGRRRNGPVCHGG